MESILSSSTTWCLLIFGMILGGVCNGTYVLVREGLDRRFKMRYDAMLGFIFSWIILMGLPILMLISNRYVDVWSQGPQNFSYMHWVILQNDVYSLAVLIGGGLGCWMSRRFYRDEILDTVALLTVFRQRIV